MAIRRIRKELDELTKDPLEGISVGPSVETDVFKWQAVLVGPKGTPYEGGFFFMDIKLPPDYPFKPPIMKMTTKIYHPNIHFGGEFACHLPMICDKWSPAYTVRKCLLTFQSMLVDPDLDNAAEAEVGTKFKTKPEEAAKAAREWTKKFAINPREKRQDPKAREYVACAVAEGKEIVVRRCNVPYDTLYHFAIFPLQNVIYFTGGGMPASDSANEQFYSATFRVSFTKSPAGDIIYDRKASMNVGRANHGMTGVANKFLFVVGGSNESGNLDSCEKYDMVANKWTETAPLSECKRWVTLCTLKDRYIFAFGGVTDKATEIIERLDTESASMGWGTVKLLSGSESWKGCFFVGAQAVSDSRVLLFGGVKNDVEAENRQCLEFDSTASTLRAQEGLTMPDAFYLTKGCDTAKCLLIVGNRAEDLYIYDKKTKVWKAMAKMLWNPEHRVEYKADTF